MSDAGVRDRINLLWDSPDENVNKDFRLKLLHVFAIAALCFASFSGIITPCVHADGGEQALLQADHAAFESGKSLGSLNDKLLDKNLIWTDSSGNTRNKSEILKSIGSGNDLSVESGQKMLHVHGPVGIVQVSSERVYVLRIWVKPAATWRLLIYHAVAIGAPPSTAPNNGNCENPCNTVPFHPQNENEAEVIHTYQAVERAVTAHDSAEWGAHIADEFFAVTSNSDRPLDKATRMAGLDQQKVGGIAPFPLVSARMFAFGDTMVMTSRQQPVHGLPLHATRVWFKRNNAWLEAYSYQTTIQENATPR